VLTYSAPLAALVDDEAGGKKVTDREQEAAIRASAVYACERIVELVRARQQEEQSAPADGGSSNPSRFNALLLDYFLWGTEGKRPEMRKLLRHATHSVFY